MKIKSYRSLKMVGAMLAALTLTNCKSSSSGSTAGSSNISISGTIGATSFISSKLKTPAENGTMSVSLGDLEVYVIYFSGTTVGTVQATVDATAGTWSFAVPPDSQINAIVRDKTTHELLGPITFVDSSVKDMSGNNKESLTYSFKTGASLGSIILSSDGKFLVDVTSPTIAAAANVVNTVPATVTDFSGPWTLGAYTGTMPTGYSGLCAPGDNTCHGPTSGEPIYMVRLTGKKFTYAGGACAGLASTGGGTCATTDGTVDAATNVDAAQIWGGGAAVESCGFKTGFSADDARAFGRISIDPAALPLISGGGVVTPTTMAFGHVVYPVAAGFGTNGGDAAPNNLSWMKGGATSSFDIMNCTNAQKTGSDGKNYFLNICKGTLSDASAGYQAMGPGGCFDSSTNKPVVVYNWTTVNGATPNCGSGPTSHPALANMFVNSCHYTGVALSAASSADFICTNTFGTFTDSAITTPAAGGVYMQTFDKVSAGSLCSGIADQLQRYKCYANAYFSNGGDGNGGSTCSTQIRFNWQAADAAHFVVADESHDKPKQQYLTSIVTYSPDGNSFTLEDEQGDSASVQNGQSSIICRIANKTILKATKLSSTQYLVDLTQSAFLKDTTVAACVGDKNNATANGGHGSELYQRLTEGNSKFLFTITK